jgi:nucleoside-diphosphate-sugar epimerase
VLVTGASGYLGHALLPALTQAGYEVRAAVHGDKEVRLPAGAEIARHGDLAIGIDWAPLVADCEAVVHLAGIAHAGPGIPDSLYDRVNHRATAELVSAAERAGVARFVFSSSIRAQSGPAAAGALTERHEPHPTDAYGVSKLAAEAAKRASRLPYTILRPVLVYGPEAKGNFATLVRLADSPLPLPFGAFANRRSLVSRDGFVDAVGFVLHSALAICGTFIVADPAPIALNAMIAALRRGFGRSPRLIAVPRPLVRAALRVFGKGDLLSRLDGELIADPAKLIAAGWRHSTDTAIALERLARAQTASL